MNVAGFDMERIMQRSVVPRHFVLVLLGLAFFSAGSVSAAVQTISSTESVTGHASVSTTAVVTCTQAAGGQYGTFCYVQSPGWTGLLTVGQSIGTNGPGTVTLHCNGQYPIGGGLSCTAKVDDVLCSPEQTISSSASGTGSTVGLTPIKAPALVECTQASGGQYGTLCLVQSPGWTGLMSVGQSIGTSGPGTVSLTCSGQYPPLGGLSCAAQVSQVCP